MAPRDTFDLHVNGRAVRVLARPDATLLEVLRDGLALRAAKRGCNQGVCGACTVMLDGLPVRACLTMAGACGGQAVQTLEGFAADPAMRALQEAMIASGAVQCGFCTGGVLITARHLIAETPRPSEAEIRAALAANLCRCTGYVRIVEAVAAAALEVAP